MTKKGTKKEVGALDWENASGGEWESLSTGFAPLWKPEEGDTIFITPTAVHPFRSAKGKKKGKKTNKINYALEAIFKGGNAGHFYTGSGTKSKEAVINVGDIVAVGTSFNLMGEDKLAVEVKLGEARLSRMATLIETEGQAFKIVFNGQIPLGGGRKVNDFSLFTPKGFKEKLAQSGQKTKKK